MSRKKQQEAVDSSILGLLLRRFTWRHWKKHWRSTLMLIAILALGVGTFLSIRLANRAAASGFDLFAESVTGESDFVIRPRSGNRLPVSLLREVRRDLGELPVAIFPLIEVTVSEGGEGDDFGEAAAWQVIGADLIALRNAVTLGAGNSPTGSGSSEDDEFELSLGSERQGFFSARLRNEGYSLGDPVKLAIGDRISSVEIADWLEDDPLRPAVPRNLILMDLPGAQRLLGWEGEISRIELVVPEGEGASGFCSALRERLEAASRESNWAIEGDQERERSVGEMTRAFRMNLTILSTLALLVGTYLILQSLEAAVVRRRGEIAVLRSLGVDRKTIRLLWLSESLVIGAIGSGLGILLGWGIAQGTVGAIARTVNGLYYSTTTEAAALHGGEALAAFLFGVIASVVAGWLPAREASETPPAQVLRSGSRGPGVQWLKRPALGWLAILLALGAGFLPPFTTEGKTQVPIGGYLAALGWLLGLSILVGVLFLPFGRLLRAWFGGRTEASYAASQFRRPLGRHRLAVAGLVAAIGMAAGMGVLVHSFEKTLTQWIGQLLRADLYVAAAGATQAGSASVLAPATWRSLSEDPAVEGVDVIRRYPVQFEGRQIRLAGADYFRGPDRGLALRWIQEPRDPDPRGLGKVRAGGMVPGWVNEAFSRRFQVDRGDSIRVPSPQGLQSIVIEGVYADYSDEAGTVLLSREFTSAWFGDETVSNVAIYLRSADQLDPVEARWEKQFPGILVRQNSRLRAEALRVFHQTFAVTYALEAIGVFVAVAGLGLAMASLTMERRGELATLTSLGFTRRQVARASAIEGAALGSIGFLGGAVLSVILGAILIFVINRQSFGWTLDFRVPWTLILALGLLTVGTSALVSGLVGHRGARLRGEQEE